MDHHTEPQLLLPHLLLSASQSFIAPFSGDAALYIVDAAGLN